MGPVTSPVGTAPEACKRQRASVIIAKLDRLARNVAFISAAMESGISFLAVDNPHANKLMLHMLAAFAEHGRDQIRARTKAALAVAKTRGVVLGWHGRKVLSKKNHAEAREWARELSGVVLERGQGLTIQQMTDVMNERQIQTPRGTRSHVPTVHRLLKRVERTSRASMLQRIASLPSPSE